VDAASQALAELLLDGTGAQAWIAWAKRKAEAAAAEDPPVSVNGHGPDASPEPAPVIPLEPAAARKLARDAAFLAQRSGW
jgi:hypothetical protein